MINGILIYPYINTKYTETILRCTLAVQYILIAKKFVENKKTRKTLKFSDNDTLKNLAIVIHLCQKLYLSF